MKKSFITFSLLLCSFFSADASEKVLILDNEYGVVYEDLEWKCENVYRGYNLGKWQPDVIKGNALYQPVDFQLLRFDGTVMVEKKDPQAALTLAQEFLSIFAMSHKIMFSDLSIGKAKKTRFKEDDFFVIKGSFFDDLGRGQFAVYVKPVRKNSNKPELCLLVRSYEAPDQNNDEIFQRVFEMVSPIITD